MATDFDKQTYNQIAKKFNASTAADKKIAILEKKITLGRATQQDVAKLSEMLGKHASDAFLDVLPGALPDSKLYRATAEAVIKPVMENVHARVNTAGIIQLGYEDAKAGLKIQLVKGNNDAIYAMIQDVTDAEDYTKVMENESVTCSRKFYDSFQEENAEKRSEMGYEMYVTREYDDVGLHGKGEICTFCKEREGTFEYPSEANSADVFARHPGCGCTITFTTKEGTMKQTNWKHNVWE